MKNPKTYEQFLKTEEHHPLHSWDNYQYYLWCFQKDQERLEREKIKEKNLLDIFGKEAQREISKFYNEMRKVIKNSSELQEAKECFYCHKSFNNEDTRRVKTFDHIKPYSKGGTNEIKNLVACCHSCNASKGNKELKEWKN